jgi:AraC-like DNA-binding protein
MKSKESEIVTQMKTENRASMLDWSTRSIPPTMRGDYFAETLSSSLCPMRVALPKTEVFSADMVAAELGPILATTWSGKPHHSIRGKRELAQSFECKFHLLVALLSNASLTHRGDVLLHPGDIVLTDSRIGHDLGFRDSWAMLNLQLPEPWVKQWLPDPGVLVGHKISANSPWGHSLASFAIALSSSDATHAPLPESVIADHLGALLAFIANDLTRNGPEAKRDVRMLNRIRDCIEQQCHISNLNAGDVSAAIGIQPDVLHTALRHGGQTFGSLLLEARSDLARRMLESPFHRHLPIEDVAHRAGFLDISHFTRTMKRRFGRDTQLFRPRPAPQDAIVLDHYR